MRVLLLRGLRVVRRHHFSMLSAAIVGGVLTVALTSSSFELEDRAGAQPAPAGTEDAALIPAPSPSPVPVLESPAPRVIYYIVNSAEEMVALHAARRADLVYLIERGLPPMPPTAVYYELYETPEQEKDGLAMLYQLAFMAPNYGIDFSIIDLRK